MEPIEEIATKIYKAVKSDDQRIEKNLRDQLDKIKHNHQGELSQLMRQKLSLCYYNMAKLSNRPKYLKTALELKSEGVQYMIWWLQRIALTSATEKHLEAYQETVALMARIVALMEGLPLSQEEEAFFREIKEMVGKDEKKNLLEVDDPYQIQLSRKFETNCPFVNKKFHIADLMAMEGINPHKYSPLEPESPSQQFFYYVVFLAIACFTRATQKHYCNDSSERRFHRKAIEMVGFIYPRKSLLLSFLKRTYIDHYRKTLTQIQEMEEEHNELKVRVEQDAKEIPMMTMPWDEEEVEEMGVERAAEEEKEGEEKEGKSEFHYDVASEKQE